ncbi:hypothetical protein K8R30_02295 [archaeon]|nr:hypothetical protein [archaeon]
MKDGEATCCPKFNPKKWDKKKITWKDKFFVKATVISLFHIPLNFARVMSKNMKKIEAAKASDKEMIVMGDEMSPFHSHVYLSVKKPVEGCKDVKLSGTFLTKVFEGPYKDMRKWIREMKDYVKKEKKELKRIYFYYTTCPKCAEKYGKNYVVLLAEI